MRRMGPTTGPEVTPSAPQVRSRTQGTPDRISVGKTSGKFHTAAPARAHSAPGPLARLYHGGDGQSPSQWGVGLTLPGGHDLQEQQLWHGCETRGPAPRRFRSIHHQGFLRREGDQGPLRRGNARRDEWPHSAIAPDRQTPAAVARTPRSFHHHPFHPCAGRRAYGAYPTKAVTH